jgi:glycosyltransferase involved in cell wall biosynthesis
VWIRERYISVGAAEMSGFLKRFLIELSRHVARLNYLCATVVSPVTGYNVRWELHHDVAAEKISVIPNGVDPAVFVLRPKPAEACGRPTVVAAARVFPLKDIETMIRSAAVAREAIPEITYRLYGALDADPPYVQRCRELIAQLGLERTFDLAGHHSNPAGLYAEGDISILSSISEAFPFSVLESMACGRPVVATDVGGVREALEGFGVVVPPRDHTQLGEGAVRLLRDGELRTRLGRQGREQVLARYRTSHLIHAYRDLYAELISREGRPVADPEAVLA